jgi:hypothetical protein
VILTIPAVPPTLNRVLRMDLRDKRDLLSLWVLEIRAAMGEPKKVPQCKMRVVVTIHNSRAYDKDNAYGACKVIFDAMKILGLIFDDREQFLDAEVLQEKSSRTERHTVIEISEAGCGCDSVREQLNARFVTFIYGA